MYIPSRQAVVVSGVFLSTEHAQNQYVCTYIVSLSMAYLPPPPPPPKTPSPPCCVSTCMRNRYIVLVNGCKLAANREGSQTSLYTRF